MVRPPKSKFVFIGGLHRSGTSVLFRCLRDHPLVSGFSGTGMPEDEGQHLQDVFPPARAHGGPGRFGFDSHAHLTEESNLVTSGNRSRLFAQWSQYWDLEKPVLLEKSPPTLIRTRFLQALFPEAYFIILMRHPVAVSYATRKWSRTSIPDLLEHWLVCHEIFEADRPFVQRLLVVRYEDFVARPQVILDGICSFIGVETIAVPLEITDSNKKYLERWRADRHDLSAGNPASNLLENDFLTRFSRFGYDLTIPAT